MRTNTSTSTTVATAPQPTRTADGWTVPGTGRTFPTRDEARAFRRAYLETLRNPPPAPKPKVAPRPVTAVGHATGEIRPALRAVFPTGRIAPNQTQPSEKPLAPQHTQNTVTVAPATPAAPRPRTLLDRLRDERSRTIAAENFSLADGLGPVLREFETEIRQIEADLESAKRSGVSIQELLRKLELYRSAYWDGKRQHKEARKAAYAALAKIKAARNPAPTQPKPADELRARLEAETQEAIARREAELAERRKAELAEREARVARRMADMQKAKTVAQAAKLPQTNHVLRKEKAKDIREAHFVDRYGLPNDVVAELLKVIG